MRKMVELDRYSELVVMDEDKLKEQHLPNYMVERLRRIRGLYAHWLQFPTKFGKDIVQFEIEMFKVSQSQAYEDLALVQVLLGNFQQATKDFMRWKINQDLERDLQQAREAGDWRSVAAIEKNRILNNRTDKEDELVLEFEKIVPQTFVPTDDPTVLGIKKTPDLRKRIRDMEMKYIKQSATEDAQFEEIGKEGDDG